MLAAGVQYESLWPGPASGALFRAPGVRLQLDCATIRPGLRLPEFDCLPYAGFQALKAYPHVRVVVPGGATEAAKSRIFVDVLNFLDMALW